MSVDIDIDKSNMQFFWSIELCAFTEKLFSADSISFYFCDSDGSTCTVLYVLLMLQKDSLRSYGYDGLFLLIKVFLLSKG